MKAEPTKAPKLTPAQARMLSELEDRPRKVAPNYKPVARLVALGLAEALPVGPWLTMFAITPLGRQVLAEAREKEGRRG